MEDSSHQKELGSCSGHSENKLGYAVLADASDISPMDFVHGDPGEHQIKNESLRSGHGENKLGHAILADASDISPMDFVHGDPRI